MTTSVLKKFGIATLTLIGAGIGLSVIDDHVTPGVATEVKGLTPADDRRPSVESGRSGIYTDGTVLIVNHSSFVFAPVAADPNAYQGPVESYDVVKPNKDVITTRGFLGNLLPQTSKLSGDSQIASEVRDLCQDYLRSAGGNYVEAAYDKDIASGAAPANFFGGHNVRTISQEEIDIHVAATIPAGIKRTCDFN